METDPFPLYHWSPTERRPRIKRYGMMPGSHSVDRAWRPPHTCWSDSPSLAWSLSGDIHRDVPSWDLWMIWSNVPKGYEVIPFDDGKPKEYRIFERIFKKNVWYVATRVVDNPKLAR